VHSDFRLIAATHRNLLEMVNRSLFREDLYFRIAVFELEVPPLRERDDDVVLLAERFLDRYNAKSPKGPKAQSRPRLSNEVIELLKAYQWPGNVRELENIMQRCLLIAKGGLVLPEDLPPRLRARGARKESAAAPPEPSEPPEKFDEPATESPRSARVEPSPRRESVEAPRRSSRLETLDLQELERHAIQQALEEAGGNLSQVVRLLGIGRTTLYRKLKSHRIRE
jgi:DNA-binding NtrC family response regulator